MVGGESQAHNFRRARTVDSLAEWCDNNLPSSRFAKLAWLVEKGKATAGVVAILKRYQKHGATLGAALRRVLEKDLDGAGDWGTAASPPEPSRSMKAGGAVADRVRVLEKHLAAAAAELASRPPLQRGRSGGRAPEGREKGGSRGQGGRGQAEYRRRADASAAAEGVYTVVKRRRLKAKKQRPGAVPATAAPMVAAADIAVEAEDEVLPAVAGWVCACCKSARWSLTRKCRVCIRPRVPPAAPAAPPAGVSGEEIAAKRAKLTECIARMVECGAKPDNVAPFQAELALLSKPVATPPQPDLVAMLAAATAADDEATVYLAALLNRGIELTARLAAAEADVEAHGIAVAKAHEQGRVVAAQMDAVKRAVAQGSATGPAGHCDAPAVPAQAAVLETVRSTVDVIFAQRLEAWNSPDSGVQQEFRKHLADAGEPDPVNGMLKVFARYLTTLQLELTTTTAESAGPPAPLKAPSVRLAAATAVGSAVGDALLAARVPVKLAAQAQASVTQTAKLAAAGKQRVGLRQQGLDVF